MVPDDKVRGGARVTLHVSRSPVADAFHMITCLFSGDSHS